MEEIKTLIAAIFGTLGFGLLFKLKPSALAICSIGGFCSWGIVLISQNFGLGIFASNLLASIFAMAFSSIAAKKMKLPSTVLITTVIIPLVPGGSLYYTMQNLIYQNINEFYINGINTILTAIAIAGGILIVTIIFSTSHPLAKKKVTNINSILTEKIDSFKINESVKTNLTHKMRLAKEPFDGIVSGHKKVELRLFDEKRRKINIGDIIEFSLINYEKKIIVRVERIQIFPTFKELYQNISLIDMGYKENEIKNASYKDMEEYYSEDEQKRHSVVAFYFSVLDVIE